MHQHQHFILHCLSINSFFLHVFIFSPNPKSLFSLFKISHSPLIPSDIPDALDSDQAQVCHDRFDRLWKSEDLDELRAIHPSKRGVKSICRTARRFVGTPALRSSLYYFIYMVLTFAPPFLLKALVSHLEGSVIYSMNTLWLIVAAILVVPPLNSLVLSQHNAIMARAGIQLRTALSTQIFRKGLRLSNAARQTKDTGQIVNILSNDAVKPVMFFGLANSIWANPIIVVLCLYLIGQEIGASVWFALLTLVLIMPVLGFVFTYLATLRRGILKQSDRRVKLMNEILSGIKIIKLYCWDAAFANKVQDVRVDEVKLLAKLAYLVGIAFSVILLSLPLMLPVIVFSASATLTGVTITASKAFTVITLFNILRFPFAFLPLAIVQWITTAIALGRVQNFLLLDEIDVSDTRGTAKDMNALTQGKHSIEMIRSSYTWDRSQPKVTPPPPMDEEGKKKSKKQLKIEMKELQTKADLEYKAAPPPLPSLYDVELNVQKGETIAIVGPVGSGKSTMLSAMLGEIPSVMHDSENKQKVVSIDGTVAYCAQQPWIRNGPLKSNVLFGAKLDVSKYREAIRVCAMEADVAQITGGNNAEIGERGINLSGGQKARVSLARAIYSDRDIYLLDDPLSAVDSHVASHIFEECIMKTLKKKTVILVTHAVQFLPRVDRIVVLGGGEQAGKVIGIGTFDELIAQGIDFAREEDQTVTEDENAAENEEKDNQDPNNGQSVERQLSTNSTASRTNSRSISRQRSTSTTDKRSSSNLSTGSKNSNSGKLVEEEERSSGDVDSSAYWHYLHNMGWWWGLMWVIAGILQRGAEITMPFVLSLWADYNVQSCKELAEARGENVTFGTINVQNCVLPISTGSPNRTYLNWYGAVGGLSIFFVTVRGLVTAAARVRASKSIHESLIRSIMKAPMSFFDTTPLGRVLNRFSADIEVIDNELGAAMSQVFSSLMNVIGALIAITAATKGTFAPIAIPIVLVYYYISKYYRKTSTELKRLESVSKSPIFALFSEALTGASTIRAYGQETRIVGTSDGQYNNNTSTLMLLQLSYEWLSIRLDMTSAVISFTVALYAVLSLGTSMAIPAGWAGLALSFSFEMTAFLKHCVRMYAQLEAAMNSVERVQYYSESIPNEGSNENAADLLTPDENWPSEGSIVVENLQYRYREGLPLTLKGLNFTVKGGERIGVVGRTGAGKSTLMLAMFRLAEASGGSISIDGVDVSRISLKRLRSSLAIIPQDPVLWSTNVRDNLDPFGTANDDTIWDALKAVGLKELLQDERSYPGGLNFMVAEGGANFSVGQRQLFCISRALLRKSKVLMLDEATASIDRDTDRFIQTMIRESFQGVTTMVIAHRLNTIMDFDRILVFEDGKVSEFDTPLNLLNKKGGMFKGMVDATGIESAKLLREIAEGKTGILDMEDVYQVEEEPVPVPKQDEAKEE